ncbi:MAG: tRNA pseudouridine(38-40) synthase TruA [Ruminococcaceae bacterium]|nr:tRNA pseudouridine(38-40) synthase TruA [Oscillospiraceae bacterium]
MKILFELSYLGTAYHGYQVQNGSELPTVQKAVQDAVEGLFGKRFCLSGCSRTDAGVHARQFFCTADGVEGEMIPADKIPLAIASFLPSDISVRSARYVSDSFHVRYDVEYKEYEYTVLNTRLADPFYKDRAYHHPKPLDVDKMNAAAKYFIGKHDFAAFMAQGSAVKDTVRDIKYFDVRREGDLVIMRVAANGFLYNMVRILCGTLVSVSDGKIDEKDIPEIILSCDRKRSGTTLVPEGLCLSKVVYRQDVFSPSYERGKIGHLEG